jgi:uncharacterized protein (TIGR02391 family)
MEVPRFPASHLQQICNVLADTNTGLTNAQIDDFLQQLRIPDLGVGENKRNRLRIALGTQQDKDASGARVAQFIQLAMDPVRYHQAPVYFEEKRAELNQVLAFCGCHLGADGRLRDVPPARTLSEASERAGRLRAKLQARAVHPDVLAFCRAELMQENYFHAVLEATKSVAAKLRQRTGLTADGGELVDRALGGDRPLLAINTLRTAPERSEQSGLSNLLKGTFGTFRNPTAHAPKVVWPIAENDALDLLTLVSYLHRRIDTAVRTPWP